MTGPTVGELRARLVSGDATPSLLVREAFAALAEVDDPAIVITAGRDVAAARAQSLESGSPGSGSPESGSPESGSPESGSPESGPLWGIPIMVKDNIDVAGFPTTAGCPDYAYLPQRSATVVQRLERAGAIVVAKTNMDQFATGLVGTRSPYGTPRNPLAAGRIPGGSSSGSAVAVAAGIVAVALGTDTAGSGRVPAALTGIVGAKPTRGWLSTTGVVPAVRSMDCVSVFATNVEDAWSVVEIASGFDPDDPFSRERRRLPGVDAPRIATGAPLSAAVVNACATLGALVEVDLTPYLAAGRLLYGGAFVAERLAAIGDFMAAHPQALDRHVRQIISDAGRLSAVDAARSTYRLADLRRQVDRYWEVADVLVLPTVSSHPTLDEVAADPLGVNTQLGTFTTGTNLCDLCAIAVPAGPGGSGDPNGPGITVLGPAWSDRLVADVASRLAAALMGGAPAWRPASGSQDGFDLAVVGAHLEGQPLHHQLVDLDARLVVRTSTSPEYRLFALPDTSPPKPGLVRVGPDDGARIEVEVYRLSPEAFGRFVAAIPAPLCVGRVVLEGGRSVSGFLCEPAAIVGARDITSWGGWRAFREEIRG
ncbi:MAG: allophanate hydrolase [Acidimicrobiales bacterium]